MVPENDSKPAKPPRRGAGILVLARDTGRFLTMKRSDHVQHGQTWGLVGGLLDPGEAPDKGAEREFREETDYNGPPLDLKPLTTYSTEKLTYFNFIAVVDHEFTPSLDHENEAFKWVDGLDGWPKNAHFGIDFLKTETQSLAMIDETRKSCDDGNWEEARKKYNYAPTLYHLSHGADDTPEITPEPTKGGVRAAKNIRETLPYLIPREQRFAVTQMPKSNDYIVIVPDRETFLKEGKLDGVIFQVPGDGFEQKLEQGRPGRWVSGSPVPVTPRNYFDRVDKLDAAMYYGLHILFTNEPLTEKNKYALEKIVNAPDYPANLKALVHDGTLIYENAQRGIHVSPFLQPEDAPAPPKGPNPRSIIHFKQWH